MSKILFREQFRDHVRTGLKFDFDSLNDIQRSKFMARFFAEKVIDRLNPGLIPTTDEEMLACVVDGADDCGVDFISRQGGVVVIIQAKYSGVKKQSKRPKEDPRHLEAFVSVLGRLFKRPKAYKMNAK